MSVKRRDLIRPLEEHGFTLLRGGRQSPPRPGYILESNVAPRVRQKFGTKRAAANS
jgi:hypothetical protein